MNLTISSTGNRIFSIPRVSGDEPGYFGVIYLIDEVFPA